MVEPGSSGSTLKVTVNGVSQTVAKPSGQIIVMGGDGNDWLLFKSGEDKVTGQAEASNEPFSEQR